MQNHTIQENIKKQTKEIILSSISSFLPDLTGMNPLSIFKPVDIDRAENDEMSAASTADSSISHTPTVESKISHAAKEVLMVKKTRCGVIRQMILAGGDGRYVVRSQRGVVWLAQPGSQNLKNLRN